MRKKKKRVFLKSFSGWLVFLILLFCSGVSGSYLNEYMGGENPSQILNNDKADSKITEEDTQVVAESDENKIKETNGPYYYGLLSDEEKEMYNLFYEAYNQQINEIELTGGNLSAIDKVITSVKNDHPEIFWTASSYSYKTYSSNEVIVIPQYTYSKEEIKAEENSIDITAKECLSGISKNASDYEKIKYVYEYLIKNVEYDERVSEKNDKTALEEDQNIDSSLDKKISVCAGYAKATKYLLNQLGIECIYVTGMQHAWNIVNCEGKYYYVDTTWGDPGSNAKTETTNAEVSYDYLLCNDTMFSDHIADENYAYPECSSLEYNYYVVNNRYFEEYDQKVLEDLIESDIDGKRSCTEIKFVSSNIYNEAENDIVQNLTMEGMLYIQKKYGMQGKCSYLTNPDRNLIVIYWSY
jgi:transglutaminase-like putative cysteine protease